MKRIFPVFLIASLFVLGEARAMVVDEFAPNFLMAKQPTIEPYFKAELSFGLLDDAGITGGKGSPLIGRFGIAFEPMENVEAAVIFPIAGTLSTGPDDYGIGNIALELKYLEEGDTWTWGIGSDLALPTANSGSTIGTFTRQFTLFVEDQIAVSPFALLSFAKNRMMATFNLIANLQFFTSTPAGRDSFEALLGYDAGVGYAVLKNYWVTIEFGGHTPLSFDEDTQFFGSAGFRYQDYQFSSGLTVSAPFASPSRDAIDLLLTWDLRLLF